MNKFQTLVSKVAKQYLISEEDLNGEQPTQVQQDPNNTSAIPQANNSPQDKEVHDNEQQLTSEGKRILIELALKCLAIDPSDLPESDKGIFSEEVTPDNAEDILQRLQTITDQEF